MARRPKHAPQAVRIKNLIALDAGNVVRRLEARREEMVALFSRLRDREPLLSTINTWFRTVGFGDLAQLELGEQAAVNQFYECLDELRWYFTYTEDMPSTAHQTLNTLQRRLQECHGLLLSALGPPAGVDGTTVVEAEVVRRGTASTALAPVAPARRKRPSRSRD